MKNKEIVKNIRKIWREELKDCKLWMDFSYNDKRSYGRRLKLVCSVIGMGYYENMELRDNVIKKVRSYVKDNNIGGVSVDGWMGGYEVVVFFNRGDEVKDYNFIKV